MSEIDYELYCIADGYDLRRPPAEDDPCSSCGEPLVIADLRFADDEPDGQPGASGLCQGCFLREQQLFRSGGAMSET